MWVATPSCSDSKSVQAPPSQQSKRAGTRTALRSCCVGPHTSTPNRLTAPSPFKWADVQGLGDANWVDQRYHHYSSAAGAGVITITLRNAERLTQMDGFAGKPNAYLAVNVDGVTQKTSIRSQTLEPVWDENMSFNCIANKSVVRVEMFDSQSSGDRTMGFFSFVVSADPTQESASWQDASHSLTGVLANGRAAQGGVNVSHSFVKGAKSDDLRAVGYARNWRVDGSADGSSWTLLRRHTNDTSLSDVSSTHTWPLDVRSLKGPIRFLRLVWEGPDSMGGHALSAAGLDLYGAVGSRSDQPHLATSLHAVAAYNHFAEAVAAQADGNLQVALMKMSQFEQERKAATPPVFSEAETAETWRMSAGHSAYTPHSGMHARWMKANSAMSEGERGLSDPQTYSSDGSDTMMRFSAAEGILRAELLDVPGAVDAALKADIFPPLFCPSLHGRHSQPP